MAKVKYMAPTASPISRSQGHKAVAAAAYRSGSKLYDEKYGLVHNYANRHGVEHSEIALPEGAPGWMADREKLWNAVEAKEDTHNRRASAQLAKEFMNQLPRELDRERQIAVGREWAGRMNERGLVVDWALHCPQAADGGDNPHIHAMVVTRGLDTDDPHGFGKKWAGDRSIRTGGRSKSPLDDERVLERFKQEYTEIVNRHLEEAGSDVRITHLGNEERGIDEKGGVHKGKAAAAIEKNGKDTRIARHNRRVRFDNTLRPYDNAQRRAGDPWAFQPPSSEGKDWNTKLAEWQMRRGSTMAARDVTQKTQSSVTNGRGTRSLRNTEMARERAKLAVRQGWAQQARQAEIDI